MLPSGVVTVASKLAPALTYVERVGEPCALMTVILKVNGVVEVVDELIVVVEVVVEVEPVVVSTVKVALIVWSAMTLVNM